MCAERRRDSLPLIHPRMTVRSRAMRHHRLGMETLDLKGANESGCGPRLRRLRGPVAERDGACLQVQPASAPRSRDPLDPSGPASGPAAFNNIGFSYNQLRSSLHPYQRPLVRSLVSSTDYERWAVLNAVRLVASRIADLRLHLAGLDSSSSLCDRWKGCSKQRFRKDSSSLDAKPEPVRHKRHLANSPCFA